MVGWSAAIQSRPVSSALEVAEDLMCTGNHFGRIEASAEDSDQPGRGGAEGDGPGRHREPALHPRRREGILRQPIRPPECLGHVDQDGVGIRNHHVAIDEHRHLSERVQGEEFRRPVRAGGEVDLDDFAIRAHQGQEQTRPVRMPGQGHVGTVS